MNLLLLIPLLPLVGFLINGIGFKHIPKSLVGVIGSVGPVVAFILSIYAFGAFRAGNNAPVIIQLFDWITVGTLNISFSFQIDQLSLLMLLVVTGVGSLIHIYSIGYMSHDAGFGKFFAFLNLFLFFMLLLVMGSNYVIMFIGWEGVGLCSYLLIGFWNKVTNYNNAARKAFIMNRIGDLGFLLGIFLIIQTFGTVEYLPVFEKAVGMSVGDSAIAAITLLLFVGAMGKSAQIPLYTWLPDAMAGPTPVSALIHAATMVTAGIYMVVRSNVLYALAPDTLEIVAIIGLATALMAASIGLFQNDIKKVLAYSTVSQLGYMFMALGVAAYSSAMFHVITHAFFKALLFLGAGSVIHAMSDEQDIRNMGGLRKKLPITFLTFLIATIAISGIPPFAGFFSKDEILAHVYEHNKLMWALGVLGSIMTSFYMFRLLFLTFFGDFRGTHEQAHHLHESPISMTLPLMVLAVLSVVGGFMNVPHVLGGHSALATFMDPLFANAQRANPALFEHGHLDHSTEYLLMGVSVGAALLAMGAAYVLFISKKNVPAADGQESGLQKVIYNKYYVDEFYEAIFVNPMRKLSDALYSFGEFIVDGLVKGAGGLVKLSSGQLRQLQTGETGFYVFAMVVGITALLLWNFGAIIFK
ncbi:MAG: NADH-quinone oxidoreductase subunit L [Cytophagia bacterium]|nr:MAG: NADH-quinone oxidoreductase subunit L [Runella sp.]TAG18553.1 MAG: NADH-quinone oxidoreductase subunit L [Cytophagales bacterium]TAG37987.1 MAG: NADH-quinone oxidoreductase subunit L [Cytophagia bacterium]TAG57904.1 MAG: NADH-quinone oxidoreductase subunit L [Runella slithyformis]TAG79412.1 MAG: NADH-quinone oxidoreductase subunit L [Cytophagales bacterium]